MTERPRLVAIDVDGTLLTSDHRVTDATVEALHRAQAAGVVLVLATSRGPAALGAVLARLAEPGGVGALEVVASQGAVTARWADGRLHITRRSPLPLALARQVAAAGVDAGLAVHWFAGREWWVSHLDATVEWEASVVHARPAVAELAGVADAPDKLMTIAPDGQADRLAAVRDRLPDGVVAQVSNPTYLEVTADGVDKATALRRLCAERGIRREEVAAIGDGPNDLAMVRWAGTGIAPANARPEVLAAARLVTAGNDDDGVAAALDTLLG